MFTNQHTQSMLSLPPAPPIVISSSVLCRIFCTIGAHPPETGGILLGPEGGDEITDFYFDVTAQCTGATYSPDYVTLRQKMKDEWQPAGIDMKGFVHSHPYRMDRLSAGDLHYIGRLLAKNTDMRMFAVPIVLPELFRIQPIVVLRDQPRVQRPTVFEIR